MPGAAPPPFLALAPATLGRAVQAEQILRIAFGESALTLQCAMSITPQQTTQSCFTALGQRALHLTHDGHTVRAEPAAAGAHAVSPEQILNDLQLAYWPLAALQAGVAGSEWQLSEPAPGLRRVRRNGVLIIEIHYASATPWNGRLWLVNFEQRYSLDIVSHLVGKN